MNTDAEVEIALVRKAIEGLGEHFDTVQIFVTRHEQGTDRGTVNINLGSGNWFARRGQIQDWLIKENEASRITTRKAQDE